MKKARVTQSSNNSIEQEPVIIRIVVVLVIPVGFGVGTKNRQRTLVAQGPLVFVV